jgi:TPR repeat protein
MGSCCSIPPKDAFELEEDTAATARVVPDEPSQSIIAPSQSVAVELVVDAIESPADKADSLFKQAKSLEKKGDNAGALSLFEKAGELGHGRACFRAAYAYDMGQEGVPVDSVRAVYWYRRAAENGEAKAAYSLGLCYAKGLGVGRDEILAAKWFARAADASYERAQYNLGYCYERGAGVERNTDKAIELYQKAAAQGSELAVKRLEIFGIKSTKE